MQKDNTILIVDDKAHNINVLRYILHNDYNIKVAKSGEMTLRILSEFKPDLILLDVMMPVMSGFELCERIKKDSDLKHIPIIFVTALNESFDEEKAFELGAVDYITKPVKPTIVMARVKTHLSLHNYSNRLESMVEKRTGELNRLLNETDFLLAEIHHRVKNNLQIINTLLYLQIGMDKDEKVKQILTEYNNRIQSIAMIHNMLYKRDNFAKVDFVDFLVRLYNHLSIAYKITNKIENIRVCESDFRININIAIPCGLIFNEIFTIILHEIEPKLLKPEVSLRNVNHEEFIISVTQKNVNIVKVKLMDIDSAQNQIITCLLKQIDAKIEYDDNRLIVNFLNKDLKTYRTIQD